MTELNINFQLVSSAQSLGTISRELQGATAGFARMVVQDVALSSAQSVYKQARSALVKGVRRAIAEEVTRMAKAIGQGYSLPDARRGPHGQMTIFEGMSETAKQAGFKSRFYRESTGIKWEERTKDYLTHKRNRSKPARWWEYSGDLKDQLGAKTGDFYSQHFGPIRVTFERPRAGRNAQGKFTRSGVNSLQGGASDPAASGAPQTANKGVNVTRSGLRSRLDYQYEVGRLEVQVFGRITPTMLPSLADLRMSPTQAEPSAGDGVAQLFPDDGPGGLRNKLLGRQAKTRYGLEPFVAFYLTRAIPNAVWRRTERLISDGNNF